MLSTFFVWHRTSALLHAPFIEHDVRLFSVIIIDTKNSTGKFVSIYRQRECVAGALCSFCTNRKAYFGWPD